MTRGSGAWEALGRLDLPIVVGAGAEEPFSPSAFAAAIADAARHGRLSRHPELGHFGPLEDPDTIAEEIAKFVAEVT
jgi:pimeloyl-ACP methyl ester carboxylesterase